ncbi:MAG TPA: bifunctional phosphopantothenoylcysteine decarboxylase/phosphopantothenate--cysteine ligase CoaBC [Cyclobacteriaceae bacterium]
MLKGRKILLGISGSIAAYKAAVLTRLLVKEEAEVKVVMTDSAIDFVTPLTFSTLSKNPVYTKFFKEDTGEWNNHVELGLWADAIVIAPATANTIARMANGICDNLLMACYLSARCPVFIAPAMDLDMMKHPATQENLSKLHGIGVKMLEPGFGELASGLIGVGRMAEPEEIMHQLTMHFATSETLKGKRALVTAGPTHEAIDPVRFIGNNSSGKMGYAIAEVLASRGASVELVSGPTNLSLTHPNIQLTKVTSAEEMYAACSSFFPKMDITVLSAAVADFKPSTTADQKIKKTDKQAGLTLELIKTHDIASELGKVKKPGQVIVGFALETENEKANAQKKLVAKNFDFIVLNSLQDAGAGFGHDTNKVTIFGKNDFAKEFSLRSKKEIAADIVNTAVNA